MADSADHVAALRAAGRDLALIHRLPVDGFGWVDRSPYAEPELRGEYPSLRAWLEADLAAPLAVLVAQDVLSPGEKATIRDAIAELSRRGAGAPARLAHSDFDPSHIFVDAGGYAGLIDFGEIRGTHPSGGWPRARVWPGAAPTAQSHGRFADHWPGQPLVCDPKHRGKSRIKIRRCFLDACIVV